MQTCETANSSDRYTLRKLHLEKIISFRLLNIYFLIIWQQVYQVTAYFPSEALEEVYFVPKVQPETEIAKLVQLVLTQDKQRLDKTNLLEHFICMCNVFTGHLMQNTSQVFGGNVPADRVSVP